MGYGIDKFIEYFQDYEEQYAVIGGQACELLMNDANLDFRRTQDVDMVLIVEAFTEEFGKALWDFIKEGKYKARQKSNGKSEFYRFVDPGNPEFPAMIELFARPSSNLKLSFSGHLTRLELGEEVSSLSAILLNDSYYKFILSGRKRSGNVSVIDAEHIIPLKMKAWLDLTERKCSGEHVNSRDIKKHRQDVFRLYPLIPAGKKIEVPDEVLEDIKSFIDAMRGNLIDLKPIGINRSMESILEIYESLYFSKSAYAFNERY